MDDKKKIVLGSEDFIAKGVDDIFININLQQTFNQIKKEKYDNNFDLAEQFRKERNQSRNFRIYGIIDSNIIDTDNISLYVYKDSGLTQSLGVTGSTSLVYEEQNVFAKKRGKYLIELDNYDAESVFIQILGDNISFADQVIEQRLVYYTLDGDFVEYGTETVDIGLFNSGFLNIENNFPFFYNKHWIKKDIEIVETKQAIVQFRTEFSTVPEGQSVEIDIVMDKPSPFGNEIVTLDAVLGTISPADYSMSISGSPIIFPITLSWTQGEQNKTIKFDALTDSVIEFTENMSFTLSNFQFVQPGVILEYFTAIEDTTPRNFTNYHFGEIYKNRLQFSGRTTQNSINTIVTSAYSILRNGLKFKNKNEAFYPADSYSVSIKNEGIDTILPINQSFGIGSEQLWPTGTDKIFPINVDYDGNEKHQVKIAYPPLLGNSSTNSNYGVIRINGVDMGISTLGRMYPSNIQTRLLDGSTNWITQNGYEKDWVATLDSSLTAITITSLTTGLPVIVDIVATGLGSNSNSAPNPDFTPYVEELIPFVERNQIPKILKLYANDNNNNSTKYSFRLLKTGYGGASIPATSHPATATGVDRYLVTSFEKICRNWNGSQYLTTLGNDCIYNKDAMPIIGAQGQTELVNGVPYLAPSTNSSGDNYYWPVGVAHINGSVLLTASGGINQGKPNLTNFSAADFKPDPLLIIPCTNSIISIKDVAQRVKITIPGFATGNGTQAYLYATYADSFRSFDFRTGTTGPYSTVYNSQPSFSNVPGYFFAWNGAASISGSTNATSTLGNILEYGYPNVNYPNNNPTSVPSGPFFGLDLYDEHHLTQWENDNSFYLESKIPGVPFEITNIKDAFVRQSVSNIYNQSVTAGDYTAGAPITVETIIQNARSGIDDNVANNWMNGYNVDLILNVGGGSQIIAGPPQSGPSSSTVSL